MVPFWILSIIQHLVLGGPKGDHNFDKHPSRYGYRFRYGCFYNKLWGALEREPMGFLERGGFCWVDLRQV